MKMFKRVYPFILLFSLLFFMACSTTVPILENQAPTITSTPPSGNLYFGESYSYDVEATDPDGDTLNYSLISGPSGMTIINSNGFINWAPAISGNYSVIIEVSDGELSDTQSFTISVSMPVTPIIPPPTGVNASDTSDIGIEITWNSVSNATHYQVYRANSLLSAKTPISGWQTENYYLDDSITPGVTYWYWVKAATSDSGDNASDYSYYDTGYCKTSSEY